jgi:hypothetical protein
LFSTGSIVKAILDAVAIPEIELCEVSLKVMFHTMLINTFHAPLEDREEAFNSVGVDSRVVKIHIFPEGMTHNVMP